MPIKAKQPGLSCKYHAKSSPGITLRILESLSLPNVSITTRSANSLDAGSLIVGGTFFTYSNVAVAP